MGDNRLADQLIGLPKEGSSLTFLSEKAFVEHQALVQFSTGSWVARWLAGMLALGHLRNSRHYGMAGAASPESGIHFHSTPVFLHLPVFLVLSCFLMQSSGPKPSCQRGMQTTAGEPAARLSHPSLLHTSTSSPLFSPPLTPCLSTLLLPLIPICS